MKKIAVFLILAALLMPRAAALEPAPAQEIDISAPSAILMEKVTGKVIYEKNARERLAPASVTKVMTLLLVVEALESGELREDSLVTASARAAGMGGSQIWLREGEQLSVRDMLKAVTVVSANDCAVALAERIAGTEEAFVARMNERAKGLGMEDTVFKDCTGLLENPEHLTTAYDIALMSRELISHDMIKDYTNIWMDYLRGGKTLLANTNKLIHSFDGMTGLKTGFTHRAMYCLSATAKRGGTEYIAVVLHDATSAGRFNSASALLNYAFANYELARLVPAEPVRPVPVELGQVTSVQPVPERPDYALIPKGAAPNLRVVVTLEERVKAPVEKGQKLGVLTAYNGEEIVAEIPLVSDDGVAAMNRWQVYVSLLKRLTGGL